MNKHIHSVPFPGRLTETDLCRWIGQAMPGDILEYHRGFLAVDAHPVRAGAAGQPVRELALLARRARWASDAGLVHLVQRRNGPGDFSYFAVRRQRRAALDPMPGMHA